MLINCLYWLEFFVSFKLLLFFGVFFVLNPTFAVVIAAEFTFSTTEVIRAQSIPEIIIKISLNFA